MFLPMFKISHHRRILLPNFLGILQSNRTNRKHFGFRSDKPLFGLGRLVQGGSLERQKNREMPALHPVLTLIRDLSQITGGKEEKK